MAWDDGNRTPLEGWRLMLRTTSAALGFFALGFLVFGGGVPGLVLLGLALSLAVVTA